MANKETQEVKVFQEHTPWWLADFRKPKKLPQNPYENVRIVNTAIPDTMVILVTYISCVVASILERAGRENCSQREDRIGYLCSKWLSLT